MQSLSSSSTEFRSLWSDLYQISSSVSEKAIESASSTSSFVSSSVEASAASTEWVIKERGGLAKIAGMAMVPSQFTGPKLERCREIIQHAIDVGEEESLTYPKIERIEFIKDHSFIISGITIYPVGFDKTNMQKCVVYNNPNACTVPEFFMNGLLDPYSPPAQILALRNCPVIMYDYRGTGLSYDSDVTGSSVSGIRPSSNTITQDGFRVLCGAKRLYANVEMWGSSLGGGVATVATELYLKEHPELIHNISLTNHDSFTTAGRVVLAGWVCTLLTPFVSDLNAEAPMKKLLERGVRITVLCHTKDFVIPEGARMAELEGLRHYRNARIILSPLRGHANLSPDMLAQLRA